MSSAPNGKPYETTGGRPVGMFLHSDRVKERLQALRASTAEMVESLRRLVHAESPSADAQASALCAEVVADLAAGLLGSGPEHLDEGGRQHLRWRFGSRPRVLLLGHFDTVWPKGTVDRWPFVVRDGVATGPGAFDMKCGIVQMLFALRSLDELDGISVLLTCDEEIGSPTSQELVKEAARRVDAVLVLEPSANGALKTARKGNVSVELRVQGRAAHAGLDPELGANASVELAHQILRIADLSDPERGTTVTPTLIASGTTSNTVPASGTVHIDVRVASVEEHMRVDRALRSLEPTLEGTRLELITRSERPPLPPAASSELFGVASRIATELGLAALESASVGGGSDGNLTASVGTPTLDGLGAVGGNAHAEGEYVLIAAMAERAALVAELADHLRG